MNDDINPWLKVSPWLILIAVAPLSRPRPGGGWALAMGRKFLLNILCKYNLLRVGCVLVRPFPWSEPRERVIRLLILFKAIKHAALRPLYPTEHFISVVRNFFAQSSHFNNLARFWLAQPSSSLGFEREIGLKRVGYCMPWFLGRGVWIYGLSHLVPEINILPPPLGTNGHIRAVTWPSVERFNIPF